MLVPIYQSRDEVSYNVYYYNHAFRLIFVNSKAIGFGTVQIHFTQYNFNVSNNIFRNFNFLKARIFRSLNKDSVGSK